MDIDKNNTFDNNISDLEIDVLLLYYNFSDQWGRVDTIQAGNYAAAQFGIILHQNSFQLDQQHLDALMDRGIIYDTRLLFNKIVSTPPKKKRRRKIDDKKGST